MEDNKIRIFNTKIFEKHVPKIISGFPVAKVRFRANWREHRLKEHMSERFHLRSYRRS